MKKNTFQAFPYSDVFQVRCRHPWRPLTDHNWITLLSFCLTFPFLFSFACLFNSWIKLLSFCLTFSSSFSLVCLFHNWIMLLSFCLTSGFLLFPSFLVRLTPFWRLISIKKNSPMLPFLLCYFILVLCSVASFRGFVSLLRFRLTNICGLPLLNLSILLINGLSVLESGRSCLARRADMENVADLYFCPGWTFPTLI